MTRPSPGPACILLTADAVGGVWTYALDLAAGLVAKGVAVTLAVLGPAPSPAQRAAAAAAGVWVVETDLPLDWQAEGEAALQRAGAAIAALARASGADLVHLNSPLLASGMAAGVPVVGGIHSCLASWWQAVRGGPLPADFARRTQRLRWGYRACDALIAPSRAFADVTARLYAVTPRIVHNGRAPPAPAPLAHRRAEALFAGRLWDQGKRVALLDAAAERMAFPMIAAGPLAEPGGAPARFRHLELPGCLDAGALAAQMARSRVFVSLAVYEPFGLAVLEAAQAGCALLLADIPTFRELWDGAALFLDDEHPATIAAQLDRITGDPRLAARLGALARERAARFSHDAMVAGTLAVYAQVLPAAARKGAAA